MTAATEAPGAAPTGVIRSMTGFGRAEAHADGISVRVEVRSVNARHLKLSCRAPSELDSRLHDLEALVREHVERGTVMLNVAIERRAGAAPSRIDPDVVADYAEQARAAAKAAGLSSEIGIEALIRLPGVLTDAASATTDVTGTQEWETIRETVASALVSLVAMRTREGANLEAILRSGAESVERLATSIRVRVPQALA